MRRSFVIHPSKYLTLLIVLAHAVAAGVISVIPVLQTALIFLLPILAASAVYYVRRDAMLMARGAWGALRLEEGRVVLVNRNGDELAGKLLRGSVVTPHLVVLNVVAEGEGRNGSVVLLPDCMDAGSFRQLRVALKWNFAALS